MADDYDSPWKEALDNYFRGFCELLFPNAYVEIAWDRGYESMDKEFQQVTRDAEQGRRYVDKLVKVWLKTGEERWVLIHIEIQTTRDAGFPKRIYVYNYRIFDRYNVPVASFVVLADNDPDWRPTEYWQNVFGCEAGIRFKPVKLLDFAGHEAMLEASSNPFAKVILAHLKTQETRDKPADRRAWKVRLVRNLYEQGFDAKDVRELFRIIDWLMELPPALKTVFWQDVQKIQQEKQMSFITTPQYVGRCEGVCDTIESMLKWRFAEEGLKLMPEIREICEYEQLKKIFDALMTVANPDDLRQLWVSKS